MTEHSGCRLGLFDPVSTRTEAEVERSGARFRVARGSPQVIFDLAKTWCEARQKAEAAVQELAAGGDRTQGVARTRPLRPAGKTAGAVSKVSRGPLAEGNPADLQCNGVGPALALGRRSRNVNGTRAALISANSQNVSLKASIWALRTTMP